MSDPNSFWDFLLWFCLVFIWIAAIMVWFRCVFDMFSDHTLSGWGKAGWALVLIFLPWIGALIYLIARGKSMTDRQTAAYQQQKAAQDAYITSVAASSATPDQQIAGAKALLDDGTITPSEFESLKAKALA
ncbi:SHOCT domain-containing protein [Humibacillus xanthopallidus]|uniref:Phospholipase D-like protein n=1 Tax=Humibacillus xanthopallidus TaxID=412689 RepID=A0A543HWX8_9MICO|nr:SHOCT domain-containing protein [Humibacillus xanthopallidus]TQM62863.1 phospholipase D-like protein [Humibacillus xanthopallidus]